MIIVDIKILGTAKMVGIVYEMTKYAMILYLNLNFYPRNNRSRFRKS